MTPQSGAGWVKKNDVRTPTESVECKTTKAASYSLKYADLQKAEKTALLDSRRMVFGIQFEGRGSYVVLSMDDYLELRQNDPQQ